MELELASIEDIVLEMQKRPLLNFVLLYWEEAPMNQKGFWVSRSPHLETKQIIETMESGIEHICRQTDEWGNNG
jgi:hypothetical protein